MKPITEIDRRDAERYQRIHDAFQAFVGDVLTSYGDASAKHVPDLTAIPKDDLVEIRARLRTDDTMRRAYEDRDPAAWLVLAIMQALEMLVNRRELQARLARVHEHANGHELGIGPEHERDQDRQTVWWAFCSCTDTNVGQAGSKAEAMRVAGAHAAEYGGAWQPESHFHHPSHWNEDGTRRD